MTILRTLVTNIMRPQRLRPEEIFISVVTALIAISLVTLISKQLLAGSNAPYIIASMGASTLLLFAVPTSPMNRPWALMMSHIVSAAIGVTCVLFIPEQLLAIPVALSCALLAMFLLHCLHPPGGATALVTVISATEVHRLGYQFVITPVALNTLILLLAMIMLRFLLRLHRESETISSPTEWLNRQRQLPMIKPPFEPQDLHSALQNMDTFIDVNQDELFRLYTLANQNYQQRRLGTLRCADLALQPPVTAEFGTPLIEVWHRISEESVGAVPVISRARHVIGVVCLQDFIKHAADFDGATLEERIQTLIKPTTELMSKKAEVAGQIMSTPVITAAENTPVADLLSLMAQHNIHHIPVINDQNKLVGLLDHAQIAHLVSTKADTR